MNQTDHHSDGDSPIMTQHNEMLSRVLDRHQLKQVELASQCQISEAQMTRVIQGSRPVTAEIIRGLWDLTQDPEIVALMIGTKEFSLIKHIGKDLPKSQAEQFVVRACAAVMTDIGSDTSTEDSRLQRASIIEGAVECLLSLRAAVLGINTSSSTPKFHRAVTHAPFSKRIDVMA